jgi:hypothetical protein
LNWEGGGGLKGGVTWKVRKCSFAAGEGCAGGFGVGESAEGRAGGGGAEECARHGGVVNSAL